MLRPATLVLSRRVITGVCALWLCVAMVGVWAPMVRAQMAEHGLARLCSGALAPSWAPSPLEHVQQGDAQALQHLVDCPLCLPVLAPPLAESCSALVQQTDLHPTVIASPMPALKRLYWPPPRGPPVLTRYF